MSTINTNGISVNYPVPGINNNSQGFRDNFTSIKTNLNTAGTEITDLQNKVIVKSALANSVLNNDMNGTLMSNTLTRSFRASTYNLGNDLSGTVTINRLLGDVQYGSIVADTTLAFTGWTSDGQNNVELQLDVANTEATVYFTSPNISSTACFGASTLENYNGDTNSVSIPNGVCQLDYKLSTIDCGANITIEPINRPRRSTQIRQRTPTPNGLQGDIAGTVSVDANYLYICAGAYDSTTVDSTVMSSASGSNTFTFYDTTAFSGAINAPIVFTVSDTPVFGGITFGTVYFVKSISGYGLSQTITISDSRTWTETSPGVFEWIADAERAIDNGSGNMIATVVIGSDIWKRIELSSW